MRPERAARWLATLGVLLLLVLILLRGVSLIATKAAVASAAAAEQTAPGEDAAPALLGNYVFPADGRSVFFQQESPGGLPKWYQIDTLGGQPEEGEPPQPELPQFLVQEGELLTRSADSGSWVPISPRDVKVISFAPSPDRQSVAFTSMRANTQSGLYVLMLSKGLVWLGNGQNIRDLSWTPDGEWLVYVSKLEGIDQLYRARRDGSELTQLTNDPMDKAGLVISPDGSRIAYLSTTNDHPDPGMGARFSTEEPSAPKRTREAGTVWTDIYIIDRDGSMVRHLASTDLGQAGLHWVNDGREVAYARSAGDTPQAQSLREQFLYAFNVESGAERRIYPSIAIERLECLASIPRGGQGFVRLTVSSTALIPVSVPVVLRSGSTPFPSGPLAGAEERRKAAVRVEAVDVLPGETKTVEWPVEPTGGITTYFSALIDSDSALFFSEARCSTINTTMGLRALPFLPLTLPLLLPGLLLMIPWLRHQKKAWLWGIWALMPVAVVSLVVWELSMVGY